MISRLSKLSRFSTVEFQNTVAVCWKAERCCSRSFAHLPLNRSIRLASTTTADKWQNTIDNLQYEPKWRVDVIGKSRVLLHPY